jgi:paraquat-inducible protein B
VAVLGSGKFFTERRTYVLFFKHNINGLRVGAPVKFNGVEIGEVVRILLNLDLPSGNVAFQSPAQVRIPVIIELDESRFASRGGHGAALNDPGFLRRAIADGLRAQLGLESLLTGLLYVDLGMHPDAPLNLVLPPDSHYQEIPTIPNALEQAQSAATRMIANLDKVQVDRLVDTATETMQAIHSFIASGELRTTVGNLNSAAERLGNTAVSIRDLVARVNEQLGPMAKSLQSNSANANAALLQATATLTVLQTTMAPDSPLIYRADEALKDLSSAARSVSQLADFVQRNPSALVRGRDYEKDAR